MRLHSITIWESAQSVEKIHEFSLNDTNLQHSHLLQPQCKPMLILSCQTQRYEKIACYTYVLENKKTQCLKYNKL